MNISTNQDYMGYWYVTDENYDGAPDSTGNLVGQGATEYEALKDYLEQYADKHGIE